MPELRRDPLTDDVVIVAPDRAARPVTFASPVAAIPAVVADCPFCPGNEDRTPPEVARYGTGDRDRPGWTVRTVPNLYPIVGGAVAGAHEVVICSPAHDRTFADLDDAAATAVLRMLQDRCATHLAAGCAYATAFANQGRAAGGSIEHPHGQVVALEFVPPAVTGTLDRFAASDRDLVAVDIDGAAAAGCVVLPGDPVAWCPTASVWAHHVRVSPRAGGGRFDHAPEDEIGAVATTVRDVLGALRGTLGDVAYNVVVNTAPRDDSRPYHWWVDVVPRTGTRAGFEFATGVLVDPVAPEHAADRLRAALAAPAPSPAPSAGAQR